MKSPPDYLWKTNMIMKYFYIITAPFLLLVLVTSCASIPTGEFVKSTKTIDYSNLERWAAHPNKEDTSDSIPLPISEKNREIADVDIFFLHPTTYTGKASENKWNANINDSKLNEQTDKTTIKLQASIFNQVGQIYAPRYRQAHIQAYFDGDKEKTKEIFDLAYTDVRNAFEYYLENYNKGRPIIIASHSQGTTHALRLMKDYIDNKNLENQLICAYLIGMPVLKNEFQSVNMCKDRNDTNCFVSWRTYREGYTPEDTKVGDEIAVVNPLIWNDEPQLIGQESHKGAILRNFDKVFPNIIESRIYNGMLWTNRPKFPLSFLFNRKNYHIADMNFFYVDIQENAINRTQAFINNMRESD